MEFRRVRELFEAVCDLPPDQQAAALAAAGDPALEQQVRAMLASDADPASWLEAPPEEGLVGALAAEMGAPASEPEPVSLGPYRIVRRLGAGSMGTVYEALQPDPARRVALKTLHAHLVSRYLLERFKEEIAVLATFAHPAIPQIHEAGEDAGRAYFVMELVRGRSLHEVVRDDADRAELLARVCDGVAVAHRHGVVHRDLKPSNLLVTAEGQPKILDFGLAARLAGDERPTGGTTAYMSPEALEGSAGIAGDVYALGVIGWELFVGEVPVESGSLGRAELAKRKRAWSPPDTVLADRELAAVLARATAGDPARRYPSVEALARDLRAWLAHRPVQARPWTPMRALALWSRRHRQGVRRAGAFAGIGALVGLGALLQTELAAAQAEREAERRWDRTAPEIARLEAEQRPEQAEAVFRAFVRVQEPELPVLSRAWRERAATHRASDRHDAALSGLTEAYGASSSPGQRRESLAALGDALEASWRWTPAAEVAARLAELGDARAVPLRSRVAFARRRFLEVGQGDEAAAALASTWRQVTATPYRPLYLRPLDPPVDGIHAMLCELESEQCLLTDERLQPLHAISGLHEVMHVDPSTPHVVSGEGRVWLVGQRLDGGLGLWEIVRGELVERGRWQEDRPLAATLADTDGDGAGELFVGIGPYSRYLRRIDPEGLSEVSPEIDALVSDIHTLLPRDLEGDGQQELIVAMGPWYAYGLALLGRRGEELAILDLERLGETTLVPWGDAVLAAIKAVPEGATWGEGERQLPIGLVEVRVEGEQLVRGEHWPVPAPEGAERHSTLGGVVTGDLDGDGHLDIVSQALPWNLPNHAWILLSRPGGPVPLLVQGMVPMAALDMDGDPADELLVRLPDQGDRLFVLGAGDDALPPVPDVQISAELPAGAEPSWRTAEDIAAFGRPGDASARLIADAAVATEPSRRTLWLERAGELAEAAGDREQALEAWRSAGTEAARRQALQLLKAHQRFAEAHSELPVWTMDPADPLKDGWIVEEPLGLRRSAEGGLQLEAYNVLGTLARLPVQGGGPVAVELVLELERVELGSGLVVGVRDANGRWLAAASVYGSGGQTSTTQYLGCASSDSTLASVSSPPRQARVERTLRLRASSDPAGERRCEVGLGGDLPYVSSGQVPGAGPPAELVIASMGEPRWPATLLTRARLASLTVEGVRPASAGPRDTAWKLASRVTVPADEGGPASWAALSALERGDALALQAALARLSPDDPHLPLLLRSHPDDIVAALPVGLDLGALVRLSWARASRYSDDPEVARAMMLPATARLDPREPDSHPILLARARVALEEGRREQARFEAQRLVAHIASRDREGAEAWLMLARLAMQDGDQPAAILALRAFLATEPSERIGRERLRYTPLFEPILAEVLADE